MHLLDYSSLNSLIVEFSSHHLFWGVYEKEEQLLSYRNLHIIIEMHAHTLGYVSKSGDLCINKQKRTGMWASSAISLV